jgi:hypothetical protein
MSLRSFETLITATSREFFNNPKLRVKDILEWSTGEIKPQDGEVAEFIKGPGVYVAILKSKDKRAARSTPTT